MEKEEKRKLIKEITLMTMNLYDIVDTIQKAENYKKKMSLMLSNQEIAFKIKQGIGSIGMVMRNSMIYEKFLESKGLKGEAMEYMQEICDEIAIMQKEGRNGK